MINGGEDGQLDQNNNPIEVSNSGLVFKMPKRGTYLPTETFESTTSRGTNYTEDFDFPVYPGQDANEIAAQNQSVGNRWAKALPRLASKVATEMAKTPGYLGGLAGYGYDAVVNGESSGKNFADWIDNSWVRSLQEADEAAKDYFKIYTPNAVKNGNLMDNLTSASFWTTEGVDGAGFLITAMLQGGLIKGLGTGSRLATALGKGAKFAEGTDMAAATAMNVVYEAASETQGLVQTLKSDFATKVGQELNPLTGRVWTQQEADEAIGKAAVGAFTTNAAILILPDYLMNKAVLGRFSSAKNLINRVTDKTTGNLLQELTPLTRMEKVGNVLKDVGKVAASESLLEEGSQFAVEKYFNNLATNKTDKGWLEGIASEYVDGLGTTEMQKSMFLGAFLGTVGGITGSVRKNNQIDKDAKGLHTILQNNFQGFSKKLTDVYEKDANGKPIIDPETGSFKKDPAKVADLIQTAIKLQTRSAIKDAYAALGNEEGYNYAANEEFTDFAYPYLQQEGGLEILGKHIDALSGKLIEDMKAATGTDLSTSESQFRMQLKERAKKLAETYDKAELYGKEFSRLKYKKEDNEFANKFLNEIKYAIVNETARQEFYQDRVNKLETELEELTSGIGGSMLLSIGQTPLDTKKKEQLETQIKEYKDSFYKSVEDYKDLTNTTKQQELYDARLKQSKEIANQVEPNKKFDVKTPEALKYKEDLLKKINDVVAQETDSETKSKNIDNLIKDLEENESKVLKDYADKFAATPETATEAGAEYRKFVDEGLIDHLVKQLKAKKLELNKEKGKIAHEAQRVVKSGNRLSQMIQLKDITDLEYFNSLTQEQITSGVTFKVIDYPEEGNLSDLVNPETGEKLTNYPVKVASGIEGTGKGIQVLVNGRMIGQFVDPNRFKFRNEDNEWDDFNGSTEHLKWLNPAFTVINDLSEEVPSKEGEAFIVQYLALQKAMVSFRDNISKGKIEFTNQDLRNIFYIDVDTSFDKREIPIKAVEYLSNTNYFTIDQNGKKQSPIVYYKSAKENPFYVYENGKFHQVDKIYNDYYMEKYVRNNPKLEKIGNLVLLMEVPTKANETKVLSLDLQYQKVAADDTVSQTFVDIFTNLQEEFAKHKKEGNLKETEIKGKGARGLGILISSNFRKGTTNAGTGYTINLAINGKKAGSVNEEPKLSFSLSVSNDEFIELNSKDTPTHLFIDKNKEGENMIIFKDGNKLTPVKTKDELISAMNKIIENRIEYAKSKPDNKYSGLLLKWLLNKEGNPLQIFNFFKQVETNPDTLGDILVQHDVKETVYFKPQGKFIKEVKATHESNDKPSEVKDAINRLKQNAVVVKQEENKDKLKEFKQKLNEAFEGQSEAIKTNPEVVQLHTGLIAMIDSKLGANEFLASTQDAGEEGEVITKDSTTAVAVEPKVTQVSILEAKLAELNKQQEEDRKTFVKGDKEGRARRDAIVNAIKEVENQLKAQKASVDEQYMTVDNIDDVDQVKFSDRLANLRKILPLDVISVHDWNIIINNLNQNGIPIAKFFNGGIYLSKYGKGSEYHEAFHAVFRTFLTDIQQIGITKEARSRYGKPVSSEVKKLKARFPQLNPTELDSLWYEEQMAEDFRTKSIEPQSLLGKLFAKIKRFINWITNNSSEIDNLFDDISTGKFKNSKRIESKFLKNIEVNSLLEKRAYKTKNADGTDIWVSGYLSADSNRRVLKRMVAEAYNKRDENGKVSDDSILEIAFNLANTYYNPDTYADKLDDLYVDNLYKWKKAYNTINDIREALEEPSNNSKLLEAVRDGLTIYKFENYSKEQEEERDDNVDESNVDFGIQENMFIGGLGSASKQMKEYLSNIEVFEDEFGIGLTEQELKNLGFKTFADPYQLYNSIEALMVNTNRVDMFSKLKVLADNNPVVNSFYEKLSNDIHNELGLSSDIELETLSLTSLAKSPRFNLFIQNFAKVKQTQAVILFDVKTGKLKVHRANMNDVQDFQVTRWSNTWRAKNLDSKKKDIEVLLDKAKSLVTSYESIQPQKINDVVKELHSTLSYLGIEVSPMFIKWSLIDTSIKSGSFQKNYDNSNSDTKDYMDGLLSFKNLFNGVSPIDDDFFQGLISSLSSGNPYMANGVDLTRLESEEAVEEINTQRAGAIGRLKQVALSNSYFDENIGSFTFQNAEGKAVYSNVNPNYITSETVSFQNPAKRHWIFQEDEKIQKQLLAEALINQGKTFNKYQLDSYYQAIKNNPLLLGLTTDLNNNIISDKEFSDFIFESFSVFINGGLTQTSLSQSKDEESGEDIIEEERFKRSTGTVHNDLDKRGKYITLLGYFANQPGNTFISSKTRKIGLTQKGGRVEKNPAHTFQFGLFKPYQTEGKSTQIAVQLPIQSYYKEGKLTKLGSQAFYSFFEQEYNRIQKVKAEFGSGDQIKGYNDTKEGRGFKFFNFSNLEKVNKELYEKLLASDKLTPELTNEVNTALEQMVTSEFEGFIEDLKSPSVNIIQDKEYKDKDGNVTVKTENYILPEYYVNEDKSPNMEKLGSFFFNDYINSLSFNNLMFGDLALNFKSNIDFVKRMAGANAAGPSSGYTTTRVAVIADENVSDELTLDNKKVNRTDAQSNGSPFWFRDKYILSYGKGNLKVNELVDKIVKGHKLTRQEVRTLTDMGALANPRKMTAFDVFFYGKTSVKILLRSQVSWFDGTARDRKAVDNMYDELQKYDRSSDEYQTLIKKIQSFWKARPEYEKLHFRLNEMESKGIDLVFHESAVKTAKFNVTRVGQDFISQDVADTYIREQVSTDNMKSKIPHGSQLMQLITAEHPNPNQLVTIDGKEFRVGDVVNFYKNLLGKRVIKSVSLFRKFIMNGDEATLKHLAASFESSLEESGSDFITRELFKASFSGSDKARYNWNLPRIETKFQNMFLSYMSKSLHQKVSGFKLTLVSDAGNEVLCETTENANGDLVYGRIISREEFDADPKKFYNQENYNSRRLFFEERGNTYFAECKISAQVAEHYNLKVGQELPKEFLEMVGVRIPTQDKHSMVSLKVVEIIPGETGNEIVMPYEILKLSGGDFDIDSEFVRTFESFKDYKSSETLFYGGYLNSTTKEGRLRQAFIEYTNSILNTDIRIQDEVDRLANSESEREEIAALKVEKAQIESQIGELKTKDLTEKQNELIDGLAEGKDSTIDIISSLYKGLDLSHTEVLQASDLMNPEIAKDIKFKLLGNRLEKIKQEVLAQAIIHKSEIEARLRYKDITFKDYALTTFGYITELNEFRKQFGEQIEANHSTKDIFGIKPITVGEINNNLLKAEQVLIRNIGNNKEALEPADREPAVVFRGEFYEEGNPLNDGRVLSDPSQVKSVSSVVSKMALDVANSTGKDNVAPSALFNIMFQNLVTWKVKSRVNDDAFDSYTSKGSDQRINAINSTQISMGVDSANNQDPSYFNLNKQSIGAMLYAGGIGTSFRQAGLINIQPEVINLVNELIRTSSEIKTQGERSQSKKDILERFVTNLESKVKNLVSDVPLATVLDSADLKEALFFNQGNSLLNEAQYINTQYLAVKEFVKNKKASDFLQNFTTLLALVRGYKTDWAKTNSYSVALKNLGIEIFQKPHTSGQNVEDFDLRHIKEFKDNPKDYPFDLLPVLRGEPLLFANIRSYALLNKDSKKFFIVQSDHSKKAIEKLKLIFKDNNFDYEDNYNKLTKELIAYYNMRAYKHQNQKTFKLKELFSGKNETTSLIKAYNEIAADEYWGNNFFIQSLQPDKTDYTTENKKNSIFYGLVLRKLITGTRNKNKSPKYTQDLAEAFTELYRGGHPTAEGNQLAKRFVKEALDYIIMKDAAMFRNNSFIQYIEPLFLNKVIKSLDSVQDVLGNSNSSQADYMKTFGLTKEGLEAEFIELFSRNSTNTFSLKSNSLGIILKQIGNARKSKGVIEEILGLAPDSDISIGAAIKSLEKQDLEKISPFWINHTAKQLEIDVFKGTEDSTNKSGIRKANIAGLLNTGLFIPVLVQDKTNADKKFLVLGFPEIIAVNSKDEDDNNQRRIYKLKSVNQPKNIVDVESDYRFGDSAVYVEVSTIGSKEVVPYGFTPKEWDEFIALAKVEKLSQVESKPTSKPVEAKQSASKSVNALSLLSESTEGEENPEPEVTFPKPKVGVEFDFITTTITKDNLASFQNHPAWKLIPANDRKEITFLVGGGLTTEIAEMFTNKDLEVLKQKMKESKC